MTSLPRRARAVMEARAEVLVSIEGHAVAHGEGRAWGIARFLAAQAAWADRQEIEARRDRGDFLTAAESQSLTRPLLLMTADGFHPAPKRLAVANDRRAGASVSRSSLYDWFRARDERGVSALAPVPPKQVLPIPAGFVEFLRFYAVPSKPSASDAHARYMEGCGGLRRRPGAAGVAGAGAAYPARPAEQHRARNVGREGPLTLRSRMAYMTRTTEDMWPTTIYTADGKTFDAEIADPVTRLPIRPEITTVLDVVTRKLVGFSLARSENQRSVAEALRNACTQRGIPAIFYVDRGPGYRNEAMDADVSGLMGRLGITKQHAAPYGSQAKGRIERPNATIWDVLARRLPTYIGADMDMEAGKKIHRVTRADLKQFGTSRNLPIWEEFVRLCTATAAEYNDRPHRGLPKFSDPASGKWRHMSPNEALAAHVASGFEPVAVEPDEADDLFRPYEIRTTRRALVQWNTNTYFHEALEAWHEKKVMVGYDYHQADRVWVREFDVESGQPGRLICVAVFGGNAERYVALSYEQKALEGRTRGRLRRVDAKRAAVEAEHDALIAIEHRVEEPAAFIDPVPATEAEMAGIARDPGAVPAILAAPRRRVFATDEELEFYSIKVSDGPLTSRLQHIRAGDQIILRPKPVGTLVHDALLPGKRLWLFSIGTGIAPFASLLREPQTYEDYDEVILTHTCREVGELRYGRELIDSIRTNDLLADLI